MRGLFITFEGVDGCGKSTQMSLLSEYLSEKGIDEVLTSAPGGCPISEKIREILLSKESGEMTDYTEAMLYAAARVQHIDEIILPSVQNGSVVLCDRYIDSSVAYQAYGRGLGLDTVMQINRYAAEKCMPDYTLMFDVSPELAFERMQPRSSQDRLESSGADFFSRVYRGFKEQAEREERIIIIDASGSMEETRKELCRFADEFILPRYGL